MAGSILVFIVVLSVLILAHELGHYFAARRAGIWVEEFGFGIPPRIFGKKIGETIYSINLLPFGGFVKLHGEHYGDSVEKPGRAFVDKGTKVKAVVVAAGVIMNFLLAVLIFAIVNSFLGIPRNAGYIKVVSVVKNSPAEEAGLAEGDIVKAIGGQKVKNNDEFIRIVRENAGKEVLLQVEREGSDGEIQLPVVPRKDYPEGQGALGVVITDSEVYFPPIWQRPFWGVYYGFREAVFWGVMVVSSFGSIIKNIFSGTLPKDVAGPAGLYVITTEVAKVGFLPLINWVGIISVNLAILNIMPIPALDGGRLLFIIAEKIFGRRLLPKVENWLQAVSLGILVTFLLAVTYREVRLIVKLGMSGYLDFMTQGKGLQ